jgi:hypothetical protein
MNDSWHLIRGVCLYRPANPDLMEAILDIARRLERDLEAARAPLRALIRDREFMEKQLVEMQDVLETFATEISTLQRSPVSSGRIAGQLEALEHVRAECEERRAGLQARIARAQSEQESLTAQFDGAHRQLERILVRGLMLACGDDRNACLHRLIVLRDELAQERKRELSAGARKGIRASAKAAFEAFTSAILQKQSHQQLDELWGSDEGEPRSGGWDCA